MAIFGAGTDRAIRLALGGSARAGLAAAAGTGVVAAAAVAGLLHQANVTAKSIESAALEAALEDGLLSASDLTRGFEAVNLPVPNGDGVYPADREPPGEPTPDGRSADPSDPAREPGRPLVLAMLGDSTSVGYGCRSTDDLPGVRLARGLATAFGRPVRLTTHGLVGCGAADLPRQITEALPDGPDVVLICIGANDIRDKVPPAQSAEQLGQAVAALRAQHIPVVVGTCPDFGVIAPIPQPLRAVLRRWSHRLALLQEKAVVAAGGRSVPIGRLVSPAFAGRPDLFASDRFHPSAAGYAKAIAAMLPVVVQAITEDRPESVTGSAA